MTHVIDTLGLGRSIYWEMVTTAMADHPTQYTAFCAEAHTKQQFERLGGLTGFGYPSFAPEGTPIATDSRRTLYTADFTPQLYGIAFEWTDVAEYTDQYGKYKENPRLAARSIMQGRELAGANLLNNGFSASFTGPDGVSLFNTAHPTNGGPTYSNRSTGNLSLTPQALQQAKSDMRRVKDPRNMPMGHTGSSILIVPPEKEVDADIILNSSQIPFTANNGDNRYRDRVTRAMVVDELTSSTAWFLVSDDVEKNGMFMLFGIPLSTETQRDARTKTTVYVTAEGRVAGWKHGYCKWGTPGA